MNGVIDILADASDQEGTSAILQKWLKQPGEFVNVHEPVAEVETDKVTLEVPAPAPGVISELLKSEGDKIEPGDVLGRLMTRPQTGEGAKDVQIAGVDDEPSSRGTDDARHGERLKLSPAVRRLVKEYDLDPADIPGSGRGGRITVTDIQTYLKGTGDASANIKPQVAESRAAPEGAARARKVPHTPVRRRIAEHMVESLLRTAPHVTTVFEADLSAVLRHREQHKAEYGERGTNLTLTAYFVSACVDAMTEMPEVNARFHDDYLEIMEDINIGVGTALGKDGLVVPVLRRAQQHNLLGIASQLQDLTRRARAGELKPEEVRGGTFTISNYGVSGSLLAAPIIINQPQVAILGVGKVEKRVVVKEINGRDVMQICPMCYVTLSIDHRALDAEHANGFLSRLVAVLENWS